MRFTVLFPLACALVAFVLGMLTLFAGRNPGYMEDYHIVMLNMSSLGHNLIPTPTSGGNQPTTTSSGGGIGGFFSSVVATIASEITDGLNDIGNDVADRLSKELGVSQFYSLHLTDACEGNFSPNATTPGAGYNVTNCTSPTPGYRLNLTELLDHELKVGPLRLSLADLKFPSGIQRQINKLNSLLLAIFVFYVLGIGFSGISMILCVAGFFLALSRLVTLSNFAAAALAALTYMIGAIITTIAANEAADAITDFGETVGVSAAAGQKFIVLSWVAFTLMAAATIYWFAELFLDRRRRKRMWTEKTPR